MGVVYKARQKSLNRFVALKLLAPERANDPQFAARFEKEARALAALNHPNIVTIHDHGQAGRFYYLLMEFVDGVTLRQLLSKERVSAREALAIVPQICDALQFAHDQGIVHRDIKPENILMDRRGRVKVADFGLAKIVGAERSADLRSGALQPDTPNEPGRRPALQDLTEAGKVMGTPQYMSPEQIHAPGEVDHRADIYALGVVFYQMLTGELPGKPLQPPSSKVQIDVRLDEVVLRALEQKPEMRYQQAGEVKSHVEQIATSACDPRARPSSEWLRRRILAVVPRPLLAAISAPDTVGICRWTGRAIGLLVAARLIRSLLATSWPTLGEMPASYQWPLVGTVLVLFGVIVGWKWDGAAAVLALCGYTLNCWLLKGPFQPWHLFGSPVVFGVLHGLAALGQAKSPGIPVPVPSLGVICRWSARVLGAHWAVVLLLLVLFGGMHPLGKEPESVAAGFAALALMFGGTLLGWWWDGPACFLSLYGWLLFLLSAGTVPVQGLTYLPSIVGVLHGVAMMGRVVAKAGQASDRSSTSPQMSRREKAQAWLGGSGVLVALVAALAVLTGHLHLPFGRTHQSRVAQALAEKERAAEAARLLPTLLEQLRQGTAAERQGAAQAIYELGPWAAPAVPEFITALSDTNWVVRMLAAGTLREIGTNAGPAAARALHRALEDPDQRVQVNAAIALASVDVQTTDNLPVLIDRLTNQPPGFDASLWNLQRNDAIKALGVMGGRALPALPVLRALEHELHTGPVIDQIETARKGSGRDVSKPPQSDGLTSAAFGPVVERVVEECDSPDFKWLDLDTGKHFIPPKTTGEVEDSEHEEWMRQTGADIGGGRSGLVARGVGFVAIPVMAEFWDAGNAGAVHDLLAQTHPLGHVVLMPADESESLLPATYLFKTREGGRGLLQITGFTENPRGVKIRYKLAQSANAPSAP
jgi:hypothetical protein